jgi:hypothetical protein
LRSMRAWSGSSARMLNFITVCYNYYSFIFFSKFSLFEGYSWSVSK